MAACREIRLFSEEIRMAWDVFLIGTIILLMFLHAEGVI